MIERAYKFGEQLGIAVWCEDEAGPYSTTPYVASSWQPEGHPILQPYEYQPNGTAKLLTLFHPSSGVVRVKGVETCPNTVLHAWLKQQLSDIVQSLPQSAAAVSIQENYALWSSWRQGLKVKFTLPEELPPLRMLLVCDNLVGHKTPDFVVWLCHQGILPLYTPLGGSWLNMAESIQRILKHRALDSQHPKTPEQIIDWLETVAHSWNQSPTPFLWAGKRSARRQRTRGRSHQHRLGGSGACTIRHIRTPKTILQKWL